MPARYFQVGLRFGYPDKNAVINDTSPSLQEMRGPYGVRQVVASCSHEFSFSGTLRVQLLVDFVMKTPRPSSEGHTPARNFRPRFQASPKKYLQYLAYIPKPTDRQTSNVLRSQASSEIHRSIPSIHTPSTSWNSFTCRRVATVDSAN